MQWIHRFLRSEDGPTAVEYAVLLALILAVVFTSVALVGTETNKSIDNSKTEMVKYGLGQ